MSDREPIKLYVPEVTKQELINAVNETHEKGVFTRGEQVPRFETKFAEVVGSNYSLAVSNGTTALHLGVRAAGWGNGDKIVTSPMSFIATTNVLLQEGVVPVFGEINTELQLDLPLVLELLRNDPTIKGILMPVIFGQPVDTEMIRHIKREFPELVIIEDAAQALAPEALGIGVGKDVDIATYSFHENKVITTMGEGGGVVSDDPRYIERMRRMREQGRIDVPHWQDIVELGYNYRMTEIQAHVGTAQLERLDDVLLKRERLAKHMSELILANELPLRIPTAHRSWFAYHVIADNPEQAKHISQTMNAAGIATRLNPMPAMQTYNHVARSEHEDYSSGVDEIAQRVLMLPLHTQLNEENIDAIVMTLKDAMSKKVVRPENASSAAFYDSLAQQYAEVRAERGLYLSRVDEIAIDAIRASGDIPKTMLDVGCGDGLRGWKVAQAVGHTLLSIDNSSKMVQVAQRNGVDAIVADISLPNEKLKPAKFGAITVLWNVLGHVAGASARLEALKHIHTLLSDNGVLVIDVNNQFNSSQYGEDNVKVNRQKVFDANGDVSVGDFTTTRVDSQGGRFSTTSHIFHTEEVEQLLHDAGFTASIQYVHYETGEDADEASGQIVVVATKA